MRVRRTLALSEDVRYADTFQDGTHSTPSLNPGTGRSRLEEDASTTEGCGLFVRDRTLVEGDLLEVTASSSTTLLDSCGYFTSLTQAEADTAFFVTDDDDSCEGEGTTTLGNLSYAVDGYEALYELILLLGISVCLCAII